MNNKDCYGCRFAETEREWRVFLIEDIKEIRKDQKEILTTVSGLKVKVAYIATGIAAFVGLISSIIAGKA